MFLTDSIKLNKYKRNLNQHIFKLWFSFYEFLLEYHWNSSDGGRITIYGYCTNPNVYNYKNTFLITNKT